MKYFIVTFGCQMNKSDSERIASVLKKKYTPASTIKDANLVVVNMCSVRQSAVDRVQGLLPKLKGKKSILTGCILKKDKKRFEKLFDYILDIKDLTYFTNLENIKKWPKKPRNRGLVHGSKNDISACLSTSTAYIPIMTGCNNFCSYCVVPYTRGREKSRPAKEIICEIEKLVKNGYKEIWLLGQNVNSYSDIPFSELLKKINKIKGEFWIKFTSSHPKDFSDDLIKTMKDCKKVAKYLNLPVQSGDNKILKKMNRPYTVEKYKELVKKIRKEIPDIILSTDVIVGFPGETKKQFENTVKLFKEVSYDMAYINKYSPRSGTTAEKLTNNISQKEKKRRERILNKIIRQKGTYVK